jgi:thymidylate synthase ThyX
MLVEYGDDSVAQLGGVHLAVEGASNVLTKVLERGRLMSYLEQSTRYIPYTDKPGGRWRYVTPRELDTQPPLRDGFERTLDAAFEAYAAMLDAMQRHFERSLGKPPDASPEAWQRTVRAKALDAVRGLLPAATQSNVGLYGSGQAFEALLMRMNASTNLEVRACAAAMLVELRKVVPAFLTRVDRPDRGEAWSRYLSGTRSEAAKVARTLVVGATRPLVDEVTLSDFDPDGEPKVLAAILYELTGLSDAESLAAVARMDGRQRTALMQAYVGERTNRRHKPGRAFERTSYRFDILGDYGAFRDLQRHRLLTIEWQPLTAAHGYVVPEAVDEAGEGERFRRVMDDGRLLFEQLRANGFGTIAAYAVPMAYRIRYGMQMNAREAMHVLELRTTPQGHAAYRRVCQRMHRLIEARHPLIAASMRFVQHDDGGTGRLEAEQRPRNR